MLRLVKPLLRDHPLNNSAVSRELGESIHFLLSSSKLHLAIIINTQSSVGSQQNSVQQTNKPSDQHVDQHPRPDLYNT
jgi:hypothetical protein